MVQKKERSKYKRILVDGLAILLILLSPFIGVIPGPGGILVLLAGVSLLASNHHWARRFLFYLEEHRSNLVDTVLANKKVSLAVDITGAIIISVSLFWVITADDYLVRSLSLAAISPTLLILLSNKKRLERLTKKLKR